MEIIGKITHALEVRQGTSARTGNSWMMQSFVIETQEQYPRRAAFEVFGEDRLREFNIQVGQTLKVSFDIDAREYQGRWYNSIRAWKVEPADEMAAPGVAPAQPYAQPAPAAQPYTQPAAPAAAPAAPAAPPVSNDDLPF